MRNKIGNLLCLYLLLPICLFAQYHSWDGRGISSSAKIRSLNIFVNIIYDVHPEYNTFTNNQYWPMVTDPSSEGINNIAIPNYLLNWMDIDYNPENLHGICTRLYGESSFNNLQITGDFIVVNIRESSILNKGGFNVNNISSKIMDYISESGFRTIYGHNHISDFDADGDQNIDYVNILIRNITKSHGGLNPGSGYGSFSGTLVIDGKPYACKRGTIQCVGDGDFYANPSNIVIHEISHSLFGGNNFHTSGGNHRGSSEVMAFPNIQLGYGLMGAAGSSLVSCNGYERWRMHWKHPMAANYISALSVESRVSVTSDISRENGNMSFVLRDFVTYGDVIRIKLPYKDSETSPNQYIWLENHQVGNNGKLDYLQYSNLYACRPIGAAGVYAYYQIGRDVLDGEFNQVWDSQYRDNLKIIPAEGYFDFEKEQDNYTMDCVAYGTEDYSFRRKENNPFCGGQDQENQFFPNSRDTILRTSCEFAMWRKIVNGLPDDYLPSLGDNEDAFTPGKRSGIKINMGTNPSTCNAKTYHCRNTGNLIQASSTENNTQTTYLTGLSIEMKRDKSASILVNIRWDDYDIVNNARWTGRIVLKDTAILTSSRTITFAQNRTVVLPYRDKETGLFAGKTHFICESGSYFRQEKGTKVYLTENSLMTLKSGCTYEMLESAMISVQEGCVLRIESGAHPIFKGTLEINDGAVVIIPRNLQLDDAVKIIVRKGGRLLDETGKTIRSM